MRKAIGIIWISAVLIMAGSLAVASARGGNHAAQMQMESPRVIAIAARRFEFAPNQITLKKGETVKLQLTTADVKHGFFQRALKLDAEIEKDGPTEVTLTPDTAGTYTVICDHFCGSGHGNMKMTIVVE
jgi:cytochrome c oxidase subunit 2